MVALSLLSLALVGELVDGTIDRHLASRYFHQAKTLSDADGGRTWGVPLYGPMIFANPETRELVANGPDKEGRLAQAGDIWVGKLDEKEIASNTATEFGGVRWTMVMWPLPELERPRVRLMMHECYHRIQEGLGLPGRDAQLPHLDGKDGRIWMRLEMRALAIALDNRGNDRLRAAKDALLFRAERNALCGAEAVAGEQKLELNEGLAEYTGFRLSGYPIDDLPDRAAIALEREQSSPTFARSFPYVTGPGYGQLLDVYRRDWRKAMNASSSLPTLLAEALKFTPGSNLDSEAKDRALNYDGDVLMAQETARAERRLATTKAYMERFISGKIFVLPGTNNFTYSYDPNEVDSLIGYGTVYLTGRFTDDWGVIEVSSGGALVIRGNKLELRISAPTNANSTPIVGDGWTLTLSPGWRLVPGDHPGSWTVAKG